MDGSKNIPSDSTEPNTTENSDRGGFFKKYTLLMPQQRDAADEPLFKRFAPPRIGSNENYTGQQLEQEARLGVSENTEAIKEAASHRSLVPWGVAGVILILACWMILNAIFRTQQPLAQNSEADTAQLAAKTPSGGDTSVPVETSPLSSSNSESAEFSKEKPEDALALAPPSPRASKPSIELLRDKMLTRAREFEDRGMLLRAEQEYRAAADSFPGDSFSQLGLRRVQAVLSAKRESEISRESRELGLKAFRMSDFVGAERHLADAVNAGRADTATLYALGMSYVKLGSHARAKLILEQCIHTSPDYAPALVGLAQANAAIGNREKALSLLQRALELGGGAEYTPPKIQEMISKVASDPASPNNSVSSAPAMQRSQPTFFAHAVHGHDLLLASCKGELKILNSVVHFNASTPSHSLHVLASEVTGAHLKGKELRFYVNGRVYRFTLNGRSARDFLDALVP